MALEAQEQGNLIGSDKVEGTAVYGRRPANKIGSIERVMIDKASGKKKNQFERGRLPRHRRRP